MSTTTAHGHTGHGHDAHGDGYGGGHGHGHVIMSSLTLRSVLIILLVFTAMTVGAAQFELWIQDYFGVILPKWVNVVVALSIATVKSTLVLLYFMQLRYDNPLNTIVFLFTLFAFALFLGFTVLDLANRGTIAPYKAREAQLGGLGNISRKTGEKNEQGEAITESVTGPIVAFARQKYLEKLATELGDMELAREEFARREAAIKHHGHHGPHAPAHSNFNVSRARTGLTTDLYDAAPAGGDVHGSPGHGGH
jgi:cytochrome c oxidase subunit 4